MSSKVEDFLKKQIAVDAKNKTLSKNRHYLWNPMGSVEEAKILERFVLKRCRYRVSYQELAGIISERMENLSESDIIRLEEIGQKHLYD